MNIQIETVTLADGSKIDVIRDTEAVKKMSSAFRECARERLQLIEGLVYTDTRIGEIVDEFFDEDPPEGSQGTPPRPQLNDLQAHCAGACIGDDGEFMPRQKYESFVGVVEEDDQD